MRDTKVKNNVCSLRRVRSVFGRGLIKPIREGGREGGRWRGVGILRRR